MTHKTTIFLASSKELKPERDEIEKFIGQRNKQWQPEGVFLHLEIWEDFEDSMSTTRKQDDYNARIRASDLFVLMVHTKVGKYTREEFETAWQQFQATGRPKILVYFKSPVPPGDPEPGPQYATVRKLQRRMAELGHFPNSFDRAADVLLHLGAQLDKLRASGFIKADVADEDAAGSRHSAQVTGSGSVAQGAGAQAAGAGAVVIGGNNSASINTGYQRNVYTSGGTYVGGNVHVQGGDFVGRDKVVQGIGAADLAALIASLHDAVARHAPGPEDAQLARLNVEALAAEAAKPEGERSDKLVARLVGGLVDLVPGAVSAVVSAFASPLLGGLAGPATAAVLKTFQRDRGASDGN